MKRLPPEHIIPEPRKVRDLEVGQGGWVHSVHTTHEGAVYLQESAEIFDEALETKGLMKRLRVRVDRTPEGWSAKIPQDMLPMKPKHPALLESVCYLVDDIEIEG